MKNTSVQYRINWERIFGKKVPRGCYYPLPSEARIAVIQYAPDFKISCLFPPKKRNFTVEYRTDRYSERTAKFFQRSITTPTLLLSHLIRKTEDYTPDLPFYLGDPDPLIPEGQKILESIQHHPACFCVYCKKREFRARRVVNQYYLLAVDDTKTDSIWAQPFRMNNVYEDGRCCFKKESSYIKKPVNLKQAHVQFWLDRFDNDFAVGVIPHKCDRRFHRYHNCLKYRWHHVCYYEGHPHEHTCDEDEEETCRCCEGLCYCGDECDCCMDRCSCASAAEETDCRCECCINTCGCSCNCYLGEAFADKLANYKPDKKYLNYTKFIFGKKYISTSKRADGIFFSQNPELLADIPSQYHKKHDNFPKPFVVGFAKECVRGINVDLHSEMMINLGNHQYSVVG